MKLSEIITIADRAYQDDLVQAYFDYPDGTHGDTLAKFIALELQEVYDSDAGDWDQLSEAARIMRRARNELDKVLSAMFYEMTAETEKPSVQRRTAMRKAIVEIKEVYSVPIEIEYLNGSTKDEILEFAAKKFEENGSDECEHSHILGRNVWTVRDAKSGDYL